MTKTTAYVAIIVGLSMFVLLMIAAQSCETAKAQRADRFAPHKTLLCRSADVDSVRITTRIQTVEVYRFRDDQWILEDPVRTVLQSDTVCFRSR